LLHQPFFVANRIKLDTNFEKKSDKWCLGIKENNKLSISVSDSKKSVIFKEISDIKEPLEFYLPCVLSIETNLKEKN
jgi:hypothetical protein